VVNPPPAKPARPKRFYTSALTAAERADYPVALDVEGIDEEIAVLRLRLRTALKKHPEDMPLMFRGIDLIASAVSKRYRLSKPSEEALIANLQGVLREFREYLEAEADEF
jgi:hypothetical protein